ncbi:MAG: hypothetical protein JWR85_4234 [Marmoricola sp.]|nr:hypothetical protein [Marmoricola sp.]
MSFDRIPEAMKSYRQWVVWRYEETEGEKPTKVPYNPETGRMASVTDSSTWSTFEFAANAAKQSGHYSGLGFVLTADDPFAFIDLDAPPPHATENEAQTIMARQRTIYDEFQSYAELSPSGKGLHIIIHGELESGRKRSSIEIYSSGRYMTMTGDVYRDLPIVNCQTLLQSLWESMGKAPNTAMHHAGLDPEKGPDAQIIEWATNAANGEKFKDLYAGNWQKWYPSQSEADFALINILAFYTQNRAQVQRLFLSSGLAVREKSKRTDYLFSMLNRCFDRMLPPIDLEGLINDLKAVVDKQVQMRLDRADPDTLPPEGITAAPAPIAEDNPYTVPPGLVGMIAQYIYAQSPRPVAEIALAGALALVAGIAGRAYNVSGTGLNQYILLLAPTGSGKEAIHSGISKLMAAVMKTVPPANDFIGPAEISSAPALIKHLGNKSISFVSIVGEYGMMLKQMSGERASPHMLMLKRAQLDLYNKSGAGAVLRPTIYSDKDKNTTLLYAPAFSMIGESTPERFYETLNEEIIADGFLPRFTIIEYHGKRVELNESHGEIAPSKELVDALANLCVNCMQLNSRHQVVPVQAYPDAEDLFRQFNVFCDGKLNAADREVRRSLWNRAHIKAMKLAAEVAVGCNPYAPVITLDNANWAINLVLADVNNLLKQFEKGELGMGNEEVKQMTRAITICKEYVTRPWSEISGYKAGTMELHAEKVIPYSYIYKRLSQIAVFGNARIGARGAIRNILQTLVDRGDLAELTKADSINRFKTSAACYIITNAKAFSLGV